MYTKLLFFIISFSLNVNLYASSMKNTITFAPLPIDKRSNTYEEFLPLFHYLEKISGLKTKFVYEENYSTIIKKFTQDEIDIILVGALPYIKLNQTYKFNEPIVSFKQKNGQAYYRCVLAKFGKDTINFKDRLKVALTQPLSTCGYYMTNILLKKNYNIDIEEQNYHYTMSHYNALTSVLDGDFQIAGVKSDVADDFKTLGIRTIAQSDLVPGLTLVVNTKTLSKKQIDMIQNLILSIPESTYKKWDGISANGFIKANKTLYENMKVDFNTIPLHGNIDEK
jgi:phosphonate transport system substrate-binding protein